MSIEADYTKVRGLIGAALTILLAGAILVVIWDVAWLLLFVWFGFRPYPVNIVTALVGTLLVIPVSLPVFFIFPIPDPFLVTGTHPILGCIMLIVVLAILLPTLWAEAQQHRGF